MVMKGKRKVNFFFFFFFFAGDKVTAGLQRSFARDGITTGIFSRLSTESGVNNPKSIRAFSSTATVSQKTNKKVNCFPHDILRFLRMHAF
jgi:hypothetical protein